VGVGEPKEWAPSGGGGIREDTPSLTMGDFTNKPGLCGPARGGVPTGQVVHKALRGRQPLMGLHMPLGHCRTMAQQWRGSVFVVDCEDRQIIARPQGFKPQP